VSRPARGVAPALDLALPVRTPGELPTTPVNEHVTAVRVIKERNLGADRGVPLSGESEEDP